MHVSRKKLPDFLLFAVFITFFSSCFKLDQSIKTFFPEKLGHLQKMQSEFPAFWWNFVVLEKKAQAEDKKLNTFCEDLKLSVGKELRTVFCGNSLQLPQNILIPWAQDYFLRESYDKNPDFYQQKMNSNLTLLSFIGNKSSFKFFQQDPFGSWQDYQAKMGSGFVEQFINEDGFFYSKDKKYIIIPVQFAAPPYLKTTAIIEDKIKSYDADAILIGVHGSSYRNEMQVRDDLEIVSWIAGVVFAIFIGFLLYRLGPAVLLLTVPVSVAVFISAKIVELFYGSIHGLTLSFGSGIIGLALDYGLHGLFGRHSNQTWKSNFVGMVTTLCGVLILVYSGIPLIRQMMVFSAIGLALGYLFYYLLFKYTKNYVDKVFKDHSFFLFPKYWRWGPAVIVILFVVGIVGVMQLSLNLDLKKLNLMTEKEVYISKMIFDRGHEVTDTYIAVTDITKENLYEKKYAQLSQAEGLDYLGVDKFLPNKDIRNENTISWADHGCAAMVSSLTKEQQQFYGQYFKKSCTSESLKSLLTSSDDFSKKEYLTPFVSGTHMLSMWQPKTQKEAHFIQSHFPEAQSLSQSLKSFSDILKSDLAWIIPLSIILTVMVLFIYYRKFKLSLMALLPFFTGVFLFFAVTAILNLEIDLISILGLVMVFGFSIDYGVFATDAHYFKLDEIEIKNVYTALTLAAITNTLGFLPMLFAVHPVLKQLGFALFFGTTGAYIGTIWGIYNYFNRLEKTK